MRVLIFHGYLLHGTGSNVYNARLAELSRQHERCLEGFTAAEKEAIQRYLVEVEQIFDGLG